MNPHALSPLDGRYGARLAPLAEYFSEFALVRARVRIEVEHALALDATGLFEPLTEDERARLAQAVERFDDDAFARVKAHEARTRHDVKACELYLRDVAALRQPNRIHFGVTSEDINNLAYTTCFQAFVNEVQVPAVDGLLATLAAWARRTADVPFPARTHGQPATPTTAGKELAVFASRLLRCRARLVSHRFFGKLNGATGTHAAFVAAAPHVDWRAYERRLVSSLGLAPNPATTQIEDHDAWARWFAETRHLASVLVDLCRDLWLYISSNWIVQRTRPGEVGSSTMPHKVNPIHFENAEGNLELASALLSFLGEKLTRSRMQRDLSDSTVSRNIGVAFGHVMLAVQEVRIGFDVIDVDEAACRAALTATPEVLAEPIQTVLRLREAPDPYGQLREMTRGRTITPGELAAFIDGLALPPDDKARLAALTPTTYLGNAAAIAREVADEVDAVLRRASVTP